MIEHCIVDLETLGIRPTSKIISIGAVIFDTDGLTIKDTFYRNIKKASFENTKAFTEDASTALWWSQQSKESKAILNENQVMLVDALIDLKNWLPSGIRVWGNGAAFDNAILSHAYAINRIPVPWAFANDRCYRTIRNQYKDVPYDKFEGIPHYALDDAKAEALHLIKIIKEKGLSLN